MGTDPRAEYDRRRAVRAAAVAYWQRRDDLVVAARAALVVVGLALAWLGARGTIGPWWCMAAVAAFLVLVRVHDRVIAARREAERGMAYYADRLSHLEGEWRGRGPDGARWRPAEHLYVADLDVLGDGSLFQYLCTARTAVGERTLAAWLLAPAGVEEIVERQAAVAATREAIDLREAVAGSGAAVASGVDTDWLERWGAAATAAPGLGLRIVVAAVATTTVTTLGACYLGAPPLLAVAALAVHGLTAAALRRRVAAVVHSIERPAHELEVLTTLLVHLEGVAFTCPRLQRLQAALDVGGVSASVRIAQLRRLVARLDARRNQLFAPLSGALLWTTQLGLALLAWRAANGPAIARWLAAVGELEAVLSLACHAFEHPTDPFPEIVAAGPLLELDGAGHPLLPEARVVRNSSRWDGTRRLLLVSGSNMSGKSTWLRTVGANVVLALAGAPVRAERMRLAPLAIGASIRVTDSLLDGESRFYAEILRLRAVVDCAARGPTLFLLDEILHGTNSHDRRQGAEAVVRALVERGAIGCVTTHDLALAAVADALAPAAANVHFADRLDGAALHFDYRMHEGVVTHSNALALMRAVGLEV